jgi:hypothetical protein
MGAWDSDGRMQMNQANGELGRWVSQNRSKKKEKEKEKNKTNNSKLLAR